jgi:hypothetical protein
MLLDYASICSAKGWWAVFHFHEQFHFSRLVVFATRVDLRDVERMEIVSLDVEKYNERLNRCVEDDPTFLGIIADDDFIAPEKMTDHATKKMLTLLEEKRV